MSHQIKFESVPNSWTIEEWPSGIYPNKPSRARYTIRAHRDELVRAGALVRVGRDLVVIGPSYAAWLHKHGAQVCGYKIAPNALTQAA
jgi:hypothetical protein